MCLAFRSRAAVFRVRGSCNQGLIVEDPVVGVRDKYRTTGKIYPA